MNDAVWNSLPLPAFIVDFDGVIQEPNGEAEQFLNAPARRLRGQKIHEVLSREPALARVFDGGKFEFGAITVNNISLLGSVDAREGSVKIAPLLGRDGMALLVVEERRDALLLGRQNNAKSAARSAIGMAEMLAHEIKNPLAGITGAAQLLAMSISAEDREMTDLIVGEARRIVTLLDQFEQFGNLRPPARKAMNIHDLLDQSMRSAKVGFAAHITFHQVYDPSLPPTFVDGDQILQVFLNLIKNAAEATGDGGEITLKTSFDHSLRIRAEDGRDIRLPILVEIIDNGPGIPDAILGQVFDPFISGRENGTGLGLALISKIISDHNAWINLETAPGRTAFRISLPVANDPTTHEA